MKKKKDLYYLTLCISFKRLFHGNGINMKRLDKAQWAEEQLMFFSHTYNPLRPTRCFYDTPLCRFFLSFNIASFAWNLRQKTHRARYTLQKKIQIIFKTVNSTKAQTHRSHFGEKMYLLNLILYMFQITLLAFLL